MANIKSAKKRARQNPKRRIRNAARRSEIKTLYGKMLEAIEAGQVEQAKKILPTIEGKIARARGKGLYKRNTAIRKISWLAKKVAAAVRSQTA